ncbi:hypothetical protein BU24DRAFT_412084 [Aaosphaeria arxii CBS 175.79]|uniref:Cytochrome P450 n=1 Tax=Aaosphaeria arxii CBS 175.79 TaxID=1450172 RepID=A0A6A5XIH1_9PLEO|nr:uncharacterized protein BU24DRAFT_412084 [Aaosphaeria arxii CBS 175.79]KAF2012753.1 hypothetical protein BU24DRAFT_412084 [Aaosphaeria arxii CBS 175.79]
MFWTKLWPIYILPLFVFAFSAIVVLHTLRKRTVRDEEPQIPLRSHGLLSGLINTFELIFRARKFMMKTSRHNGAFVPNKVPLLFGNIYLIRGPESLETLWKLSGHSSSTELHGFYFGRIFGMPGKAESLYANDDSGFASKPHPASNVHPNSRIDYITHQVLKEFLLSDASMELAPRFLARIQSRFAEIHIGYQWSEKEDLLGFLEMELLKANMEISHHMYGFYRPFPKWTIRKAHAARARILAALKEWQMRVVKGEMTDKNVYWTATKVKKWHAKFLALNGFDDDTIASLYLGIIWVSNYNFIISIFWMVLETYRCPSLLTVVKEPLSQISAQLIMNEPSQFALIQSIYAETLRLRTEAYITRRFPHRSVELGKKWVIPRNKICLASTHPAHQDNDVWNTYDGLYPLNTFWAERFLVHHHDPLSGPLNPAYRDTL